MEEMYKLLLKISDNKLPSFIITADGKIIPAYKGFLIELMKEYIASEACKILMEVVL